MDPGEVPEELQGLTEIREMLIARVFIVISVTNCVGKSFEFCGSISLIFRDNEEEIAEVGKLLEEIEDDQDEYSPDWMILVEIGPNATIERSSDLEYGLKPNP
ncbi:hypothetical protein RhiirA4_430135 [Rhizophagus irregularis]|uniref:DUF6570 domain-containing protein n=1 Tax=Rhizophagus irregularis TaxID=588596 RepID=A0A2I1HJH5_9GLOM|nr:hypothetical protein RhiirA4_430135 [Rhizophagus irregularis]